MNKLVKSRKWKRENRMGVGKHVLRRVKSKENKRIIRWKQKENCIKHALSVTRCSVFAVIVRRAKYTFGVFLGNESKYVNC